MRLMFKQRMLTLLDSYDIYDEDGNTVFTVEGRFDLGHHLDIYDYAGNHVGEIKQKVLTMLPRFEIYMYEEYCGEIWKELSWFPEYNIECSGWHIEGSWTEWDYTIVDEDNNEVAVISKELLQWTDTYFIDVEKSNALLALLVVLAIDCEKCSRN